MPLPSQQYGYPIVYILKSDAYCNECAEEHEGVEPHLSETEDPIICCNCG